ncbi:MAG: alkaline phosphatase [Clostridia bacterium]|nr:alkaline phosphatase [Clostridia bacterium]
MGEKKSKKSLAVIIAVIAVVVVAAGAVAGILILKENRARKLAAEEQARLEQALATAQTLADDYRQSYIDKGYTAAPDGKVFEIDGYAFALLDGKLEQVTPERVAELKEAYPEIKNIIFLIPDGAGFGTYDVANAYKHKYSQTAVDGIVDGIADTPDSRQATQITTNRIEGKTVTGLYLDEYMIATANTAMMHEGGHSATDSAAAGTALLCGKKTVYTMTGVTPDFLPVANILEAARLDGKTTGFVTTKCLVDATPSAGTIHSLRRPDQDSCAYQTAASPQILNSRIDVELCYGSDGGYVKSSVKYSEKSIINDDRAANHGYTVVTDLASLRAAVDGGAKKLFSRFQINFQELIDNGADLTKTNYNMTTAAWNTDYQGQHILYDVDAREGDLTLMDLALAALKVLDENINDPDGFCLVIEGGAIDNAAEGRNVKEAVAEYLAFDEVFGYCVNWAMKRGDTIVVACPDHDSGGFYNPETQGTAPEKGNKAGKALSDIDTLVTALHDGAIKDNTIVGGAALGHSPQNVPVWLYAPEPVRAAILKSLNLPEDAATDKVRTGLFYDGSVFDEKYIINNSDIAHAVVEAAGVTKMDTATAKLFVPVYDANDEEKYDYGTYDAETGTFTFKNGTKAVNCSPVYTDAEGNEHTLDCGLPLFLTNPVAYKYEDDSGRKTAKKGEATAVFYVPLEIFKAAGN